MQNAANNNSNFTVEALVAKYRNYVMEHCPKQLATYPIQEKMVQEEVPVEFGSMQSLLLTLYKDVAGKHTNDYVVKAMGDYASQYETLYKGVFTWQEYDYLKKHFSDFVDYILPTLSEKVLSEPSRLELVKEYLTPKVGSKVFLANTGCDVACLFPKSDCEGYFCNEDRPTFWAIGMILLYAKGLKLELQTSVFYEDAGYQNIRLPQKGSIDYIVYGAHEDITYDNLLGLYDCLSPKGRMLVFLDKSDLQGRDVRYSIFRQTIVNDKAISSIIAYRDIQRSIESGMNRILLVIDKRGNEKVEIVSRCTDRISSVSSSELNPDMLWPGYYLTSRPEYGIPLSCLAEAHIAGAKVLKDILGGKLKWEEGPNGERIILPDWMLNLPIATRSDMSINYKDANLCMKELHRVSDPSIDDWRIRIRVVSKPCVILSGGYAVQQKFYLGYYDKVANRGYAIMTGQPCLLPKEMIDVRYLAALLLTASVKEQILSVCDEDYLFGSDFRLILDWVIVPNHTEKERLEFLADVNYEALQSSQKELVQEHLNYTKAVRMRKHALSQSFSAMKAMFSVLNTCRKSQHGVLSDGDKISPFDDKTVRDAFEFLAGRFDSMAYRLDHIADVEYAFSNPEWIDPESFVEKYVDKNKQGWINFKPQFSWEEGHNLAKEDLKDPSTGKVIIKIGEPLHKLFFSHDALERVISNIVSNAQAHGFTEANREDYILRFSWHLEGTEVIIEIENNGTPIPSDRSTSSLLEYGVSSALNKDGHNGIGCNEIDNIMRKYDGSVKIVSTPNEEFTVKYILSFEHTNSIELYNL